MGYPTPRSGGDLLADMLERITLLERRRQSPASPTGLVSLFAGTDIPAGWLTCNGAAVSRTTYSPLFGAIGTAHGAGDGSTTFNLPNLTSPAATRYIVKT